MEIGKVYTRDRYTYKVVGEDGNATFCRGYTPSGAYDGYSIVYEASYYLYKEVKPKIKKRYKIVHCQNGHDIILRGKDVTQDPLSWHSYSGPWTIIAITEHAIEFEEGEGIGA